MDENRTLPRSGSLGGSMISRGTAGPERTNKIRDWIATKIQPLIPGFLERITKLERAYHMPLAKSPDTFETLDQVVAVLRIIAALLCRLLYFLTSSKLAETGDLLARLQFVSDWEQITVLPEIDIEIYRVVEPVVAATVRIEQTLDKLNLHSLATAESIEVFPPPSSTKDMLNLTITRAIKAHRFFDIMTFGLLMRKLDYSMLRAAGVIATLKQMKTLFDEGKVPEEDYFKMRMTIIDPHIPKARSPSSVTTASAAQTDHPDLPTSHARTAATLRVRPGRHSTFETTSTPFEHHETQQQSASSAFDATVRVRQRPSKVVSFCASPRAAEEKPFEELTDSEKIAHAVSQTSLTVPHRRESFAGVASPRELTSSASAPIAPRQTLQRSTTDYHHPNQATQSEIPKSASMVPTEKKATPPIIPPKPKIDLTLRGPPPPGSLGPKIPKPEDVNPDLAARLLRNNSSAVEGKPLAVVSHEANMKLFEDLARAKECRKKQDDQLELEVYMRRQQVWEEQRRAEKEKERKKAQETIRNGTWRTTGLSQAEVHAMQHELTKEEAEKRARERAKSEAEMQRRTTVATMRLGVTGKDAKDHDPLFHSRQVDSKSKK